uniref:Uncharacterized protein n=1 Tax=Panagrolaimus sp. PS1159 TaxID=55785 RepID=A0AC35F9H2_9BILA
MILILLHVGLIIVLFVCFAVINFLLDKWVFVLPLIIGIFAISAAIDLFITVACYRFVAEERQLLTEAYITSINHSKQVHFKKKHRRHRRN